MSDPSYRDTGVDTHAAAASISKFSDLIRGTFNFHQNVGRVMLDLGYFANVIDLGNNTGLAISTDGVGTKILIAQAMNKYDTVGIDCMAMNVNDLLCVGAEPLALVDYIAVESAQPDFIYELMQGIYEGAKLANVSIPAGEIAQVKELIHGSRDGKGFDLVASCVGTVPLDKMIIGKNIIPGDTVIGVKSSGLHSNGYTMARRVLLQEMNLSITDHMPELNRTLGEEMLEPTHIYVKPVVKLLQDNLNLKALINITGDGLFNLIRVDSETGYEIDFLPIPQPIFQLIQNGGKITNEEMYTVFNMGIGFCVVIDPSDAQKAMSVFEECGFDPFIMGKTTHDTQKKIHVFPLNLEGKDGEWIKV
jgi:phosphoribosylformylglycinamidine cyclo-ligase